VTAANADKIMHPELKKKEEKKKEPKIVHGGKLHHKQGSMQSSKSRVLHFHF